MSVSTAPVRLTVRRFGETTRQDAWWVQSALNVVEERVRHYPEQSNDYFFWSEDADGHAA